MKLFSLSVAIATTLVLTACGPQKDNPPEDDPTQSSSPSPTSTTAEPTTPSAPQDSSDLVIEPGAIGPAKIGMSKAEAKDTGLFDFDVKASADCTVEIEFKKQFSGTTVGLGGAGTLTSLGAIGEDGPRTADDRGVGSTFGELIETYGGELSAPREAGYGQVGVFVRDGDKWLGFLFGDINSVERANNDPGVKVTYVQTTVGVRPGLAHDGC